MRVAVAWGRSQRSLLTWHADLSVSGSPASHRLSIMLLERVLYESGFGLGVTFRHSSIQILARHPRQRVVGLATSAMPKKQSEIYHF